MGVESLIGVLVKEHRVMGEMLSGIRESARQRNFQGVADALRRLDSIFRQHIADEESQLLRLLIGELGRAGAEEEIRVFQQHRPIHRLMGDVAILAAKSAAELEKEEERLNALLAEHTALEEARVFPKALRLARERRE